MKGKTKSELIFEGFCCANKIPCEKMPECQTPTPDYKIVLNTETIFVEVTQIDKTNKFKFTTDSGSRTQGDHVRAKIDEKRKQARVALNDRVPFILLIYNNLDSRHAFGTERGDFLAAMYGELTVVLNQKEHSITDSYHGRNQSLRQDKNTSFSAVGLLYQNNDSPAVRIYENDFAENKLDYPSLPKCIEAIRCKVIAEKASAEK